jgi:hypothetical protein
MAMGGKFKYGLLILGLLIIWGCSGDEDNSTAPDTTRPTVVLISPADGDTNVAVNAAIFAQFSEEMDHTTINTTTFNLTPTIDGAVSYSNKTAVFASVFGFDYDQTYQVRIETTVRDLAGNSMASTYTWSFTTEADTTQPVGVIMSPDIYRR